MKLLMYNVREFWYKTFRQTLDHVDEIHTEETINDAVVVFMNVEREDEAQPSRIIRKTVRTIAWLARKNHRDRIVLHSFAHLSDSKASVDFAHVIIQRVLERLTNKGYAVSVTPFGYFLEFKLHVLGESLAKVWKSLT